MPIDFFKICRKQDKLEFKSELLRSKIESFYYNY